MVTTEGPGAARPRILYGHRGAPAEQPENTLPSFQRALEVGATALEIDVHLTADGHVVVAHDPTGARTAGVPTAIRAASLGEVRRWDVGWGFRDARGERPFAGRGYRVPTLDEVLTEFPGVRLNVDLKAHTAAMVDATIAAVRRHGAEDHVLLTSFDSATLRAVRRRGYAGPTGLARNEILLLFLTPLAALARVGVPGQAVQIPPRVGLLALDTRPWIARCHALGLRVDYWVINEPAEARRLLALGADGIVTDDPAAIAPVFREA